jgi:hypothetical protein
MDETRQRLNEEKEDKVRRTKEEAEELGRELRYTQQVVAAELAGWQDLHEKMGRKAIKDLARGMLIKEKIALEGMRRAIRKLKVEPVIVLSPPPSRILDLDTEVNGSVEEVNGEGSSGEA